MHSNNTNCFQKYTTIVCCLFSLAIAVDNKKIQLEDIERDNLASERNVNYGTKPKPHLPSGIKMQYGFRPMKNPPVIQQQHEPQYQVQYQYQPQFQYYTPQEYNNQYAAGHQQTTQQQQYQPQFQQQYQYQTIAQPQPEAQALVQHQIVQQPTRYTHLQQQSQQQPQQTTQYQQATQYQEPTQYQQPYFLTKNENLQSIIDNHLQNYLKQSQQQYVETPQYVYVQPNQEASDNVQSVVDSKGNLQYYTYVPVSQVTQGDFVQSDLTDAQTYNVAPQISPSKDAALSQNTIPYEHPPITIPFKHQYNAETVALYNQAKAIAAKYPTKEADYSDKQSNPVQLQKQVMLEFDYSKRKPQSLLESYVPSILQYQYYKAQQARIQQQFKNALTAGKSSAVKQAYKIQTPQETTSQVTYQQVPNYQHQN